MFLVVRNVLPLLDKYGEMELYFQSVHLTLLYHLDLIDILI
jgi:hypothetical protein